VTAEERSVIVMEMLLMNKETIHEAVVASGVVSRLMLDTWTSLDA
jgi:hypothetical protein